MDIINLDDKRIKSLDSILKKCLENPNGPINIMPLSKAEREFMETSFGVLKEKDLIRQYVNSPDGAFTISITQIGIIFIENDSFENQKERKKKELEIEEEKLDHARIQHQVNKNALRAAKWQPYLIIYSIISTLAAILISILK